jgi:hypothetical protein
VTGIGTIASLVETDVAKQTAAALDGHALDTELEEDDSDDDHGGGIRRLNLIIGGLLEWPVYNLLLTILPTLRLNSSDITTPYGQKYTIQNKYVLYDPAQHALYNAQYVSNLTDGKQKFTKFQY